MRITNSRLRASTPGLATLEAIERSLEVVSKFVIGKEGGFKTAPDQVYSGLRRGGEVINERSQLSAEAITDNGVSYLSPDREGYGNLRPRGRIWDVTNAKRTTLTPGL